MQRVILRELRRIMQRPRYLTTIAAGFVFACVFFISLLHEGQPQKLPVAVVDHDGSYLSRRLCHELEATPAVTVKAVYSTFNEARTAMQKGEIYAFYEIPAGTYNELLQFHSPHFGLYTNNAFLLGGSLSYKQLATFGTLAAGAVQREVLRKKGYTEDQIMGLIQPLSFDYHQIGNPWASYTPYILPAMLPAILAYMVLLHTIFIFVQEQHERTARGLFKKAGGNMMRAVVGKLVPYTAWYTLLGLLVNLVIFAFVKVPMEGSWLLLCLHMLLMVAAAQCVGVLIAGCVPDRMLAMSVGAIYGALGFSLSGFSFPVTSMLPAIQGISWLYPIRHYYLSYLHIAVYGNGLEHTWPHTCALLAFGVLLAVGVHMMMRQYDKNHEKATGRA